MNIKQFEKIHGNLTFGKAMKIRIISKEDYRKRTIAIARGEYTPGNDEPKIFFESMESLGQILTGQNQKLLKLIRDKKTASETPLFTNKK